MSTACTCGPGRRARSTGTSCCWARTAPPRSAAGPLLTLRLGRHGVCTQEITIRDSPGLRTALRVLLDHGESPGPDPSE